MRIAAGFLLIAFFMSSIFYSALVTRDLKQKPELVYVGAAFTAVWAMIYICLLD